jgi:uncharacterized protein (TIRG00374 family)
MSPEGRKRLGAAIRLAVCAGAIAVLAVRTNWSEFAGAIRSADGRLVLLSILAFAPAPVLISLRLKWLLAVHDVHLGLWQALKVTFAGNFIISALPVGTSGGDALKAFYIARDTPHKHEAITTIFFDRVIGVVGLILMSGLMVLLNWGNPAFEQYGRPIALLTVCFFAGAGVYFSRRMRKLLRLDEIVARLPLAAHVQRVDRALFSFSHHRGRVLAALLLTMLLQGIAIVSLFFGGWAVGLVGASPAAAFPVYLAYVPICFLTGALPIGVMELTFVQLFSRAAGLGSEAAAVALSILGRFIQLVWALPGGIVVLKGGSMQAASESAEDPPAPEAVLTESERPAR